MIIEIDFSSDIGFSEPTEDDLFRIKGLSCRSGYIESKNFILPTSELESIKDTLMGGYIVKDHGKSVDSALGRIDKTYRVDNEVFYEGNIHDDDIEEKIRNNVITSSSVGLRVDELYCSTCGAEYGTCSHMLGKEYDEVSADAKEYLGNSKKCAIVGRNISGREQSLVLYPAIQGADVAQFNFSATSLQMIEEVEANKIEPDEYEITLELAKTLLEERDEKIKTLEQEIEVEKDIILINLEIYEEIKEENISMKKQIKDLTDRTDLLDTAKRGMADYKEIVEHLMAERHELKKRLYCVEHGLDFEDLKELSLDEIEKLNTLYRSGRGSQGIVAEDDGAYVQHAMLNGELVTKADILEKMRPKHDMEIERKRRRR